MTTSRTSSEWLAQIETAIAVVEAADATYEAALGTDSEWTARDAYTAAKDAYREIEADAFADGFYWTCGRCGGTGVWVGNGGTCYNCFGSGFHPNQTKHKFAASPLLRAKRAAEHEAKVAAEQSAYEQALRAIGGRVEARLREVAETGDRAMYQGEGYYGLSRDEAFVYGLVLKLRKYGKLSDAQVAAIERGIARTDEQAAAKAKLAETAPLVEGRYEIEGEVVSTKWQESQFGSTFKMLVAQADGTKVYGTVPAAFDFDPKGMRVAFTAKVERSGDDQHFGFFSRPTKARVID